MLFGGLGEEHTSWVITMQNVSQKDTKPLEFSIIIAQLLDETRILSKSLGRTDTSIALFGKSEKQKFSLGISSNVSFSIKQFMPRGKPTSKKTGYDKATAKYTYCNKSYYAVKECWFLHPKKAKKSWLARNPVSHTEQPINLMIIGTLLFDESVEPTRPTPQNG